MKLKEPIVEGAYYKLEDGCIIGPSVRDITDQDVFWIGRTQRYRQSRGGEHVSGMPGLALTRRVYLVPTDPAEVVAELRELADQISKARHPHDDLGRGQEGAFDAAADLVAEKLGVKP